MAKPADLFTALNKKTGFEVVNYNDANPDQLRIVGRLLKDQTGLNLNNFKILMHRLDVAGQQRPWKVDMSKWHFVKPETGKLVYAWRLIFQGKDLAKHIADIVNIVNTSPVSARVDVTEMPLAGAGLHREGTAGGRRGAGLMGTVATGAAAMMQKRAGG